MIKSLKVKWVGLCDLKGKEVACVFIAYRLGNQRHVYDTMVICSNKPAKEYERFSFIPVDDLTVKCQENGHPCEIWFNGGIEI